MLSPLFCSFFLSPRSPLSLLPLVSSSLLSSVSSVFIGEEKVLGPLLVRLGAGFAGGWSATTHDSKAPFLLSAGGRPMPSVGGPNGVGLWVFSVEMQGREGREVFEEEKPFFLLPCNECREEDEGGTVSFKTAPFGPSFLFFYV